MVCLLYTSLRALGYEDGKDFTWSTPWTLTDQLGITDGDYTAQTATFLRADAAVVSANALYAPKKGEDKTCLLYTSRPLPCQLANQTRGHLRAINLWQSEPCDPTASCGISTNFSVLFPSPRQVPHALLTRPPLRIPIRCPKTPSRVLRSTCMC